MRAMCKVRNGVSWQTRHTVCGWVFRFRIGKFLKERILRIQQFNSDFINARNFLTTEANVYSS